MNIVTEIIGPIASATEMNDMIVIITEVMKGGVTLDGGVLAEVWAAAGVVVVIMSVLAGELKAYQLAASGLLLPAAGMWDNCYLFLVGVFTPFSALNSGCRGEFIE